MNLVNKIWYIAAILIVLIGTGMTNGFMTDIDSVMWFVTNAIGIIFVVEAANQGKLTQHFGALFTVCFAFACYENGLYANALVNILVLFPISVIGIFYWESHKEFKPFNVKTSVLLLGMLFITLAVYNVTKWSTGFELNALDLVSALAIIVATILMAVKDKRCWSFWIAVNLMEMVLWLIVLATKPEVLGMVLLRSVFLVNSIIGFWNWNHGNNKD